MGQPGGAVGPKKDTVVTDQSKTVAATPNPETTDRETVSILRGDCKIYECSLPATVDEDGDVEDSCSVYECDDETGECGNSESETYMAVVRDGKRYILVNTSSGTERNLGEKPVEGGAFFVERFQMVEKESAPHISPVRLRFFKENLAQCVEGEIPSLLLSNAPKELDNKVLKPALLLLKGERVPVLTISPDNKSVDAANGFVKSLISQKVVGETGVVIIKYPDSKAGKKNAESLFKYYASKGITSIIMPVAAGVAYIESERNTKDALKGLTTARSDTLTVVYLPAKLTGAKPPKLEGKNRDRRRQIRKYVEKHVVPKHAEIVAPLYEMYLAIIELKTLPSKK